MEQPRNCQTFREKIRQQCWLVCACVANCVLVQCMALSINYAWSINHGDKYPTASAFYAFVEQKFCKERNFLVRKTSTCKKAPKGIPEGCHPPDGIYSQRVICTLAGASAAKKEGIQAK